MIYYNPFCIFAKDLKFSAKFKFNSKITFELERAKFCLEKNTERAMFNAKVLKFKMLLSENNVNINTLPGKLGMKNKYRLNWLLNDLAKEDRLSVMDDSEILLLAHMLHMDAKQLAAEYGLGDQQWFEAEESAADLSLPAAAV